MKCISVDCDNEATHIDNMGGHYCERCHQLIEIFFDI